MATPPFENNFSGILSGRSRGAWLPNLKFVSLAVLELLAFTAHNLQGDVTVIRGDLIICAMLCYSSGTDNEVLVLVYRGEGDESRQQQTTVDWSWGTVKYRLNNTSTSDEDDDDVNENVNDVSSPQPADDVQPPSHNTQLHQVTQ